jgi:D-alanine-D-alanine ligase
MKIIVLLGGESSERRVSLSSGEAVAHGLAALMETLDRQRPEVIFPMLHGGMGEDGRLQAALEMVGLRFVGPESRPPPG